MQLYYISTAPHTTLQHQRRRSGHRALQCHGAGGGDLAPARFTLTRTPTQTLTLSLTLPTTETLTLTLNPKP